MSWAAAAPNLRGAACMDRSVRPLFDKTAGSVGASALQPALAVCSRCPVLAVCRQWVLSLPDDQRPRGLVGGLVVDARYVTRSAVTRRGSGVSTATLMGPV